MWDMHIFSTDEYKKKQRDFISKNIMMPLTESDFTGKKRVIKNYVYYSKPVKIY